MAPSGCLCLFPPGHFSFCALGWFFSNGETTATARRPARGRHLTSPPAELYKVPPSDRTSSRKPKPHPKILVFLLILLFLHSQPASLRASHSRNLGDQSHPIRASVSPPRKVVQDQGCGRFQALRFPISSFTRAGRIDLLESAINRFGTLLSARLSISSNTVQPTLPPNPPPSVGGSSLWARKIPLSRVGIRPAPTAP